MPQRSAGIEPKKRRNAAKKRRNAPKKRRNAAKKRFFGALTADLAAGPKRDRIHKMRNIRKTEIKNP
jgi:hypothetical protein